MTDRTERPERPRASPPCLRHRCRGIGAIIGRRDGTGCRQGIEDRREFILATFGSFQHSRLTVDAPDRLPVIGREFSEENGPLVIGTLDNLLIGQLDLLRQELGTEPYRPMQLTATLEGVSV